MSAKLRDRLVEIQRSVRTRPLFTMRLETKLLAVGATPTTTRRIGIVPGGIFEGGRLSGRVLDGGSDWQSIRGDCSTLLDVRLNLETQDGALICMTYKGVRHGPREVIQRLEAGEAPRAITSASRRCSRQPLKPTAGSMASSRSGSAIASPTVRFTTCSKCCEVPPVIPVTDKASSQG
jgi:Protein of unknown function (DUF3237)